GGRSVAHHRGRRGRGRNDDGSLLRDLFLELLLVLHRQRQRDSHLGSEARSAGSVEERGRRLVHRRRLRDLRPLRLPLAALARFPGGLGGERGLLAGRALLLDPRLQRALLLVALRLVLVAAVDPLLARGEGVDLEGPLQLVRGVLVYGARRGLHVDAELLQPVDDVLALQAQVSREVEDPNVAHPHHPPRPSSYRPRFPQSPRLRRRARPRRTLRSRPPAARPRGARPPPRLPRPAARRPAAPAPRRRRRRARPTPPWPRPRPRGASP